MKAEALSKQNTQNNLDSRTKFSLVGLSFVTLVLYLVPIFKPIAYPFMLLSTLVHEMGHGLAAIIVGGKFNYFQMFFDGSGAAFIAGDFGRLGKAFVASLGLILPSIVASIFFLGLQSINKARVMLALFGLLLSISLILVVRNAFGIFFVSLIALLCFFFSLGKGKKYAQSVLGFFALQLSLSVFSRSDYLFTKTAITSLGAMPSDVEQIAQALFLPYWFWGALLGLFSVIVLFYGIKTLIK